MDYFDLLHKATINNKHVSSSQDNRCYKASFSAPKKMEKSRVSSDNIKKFLARKEEEENRKLLDAKRKKEDLLALRAQDKKAHKRVQTMLKRTKSANKSVMEDAIDNYNTKDTLEGPKQCDEDDYGYVSQEASAFYEKLMAKYENGPTETLKGMNREVKDLKAAKDRVKAALDKEAEEQLHPTRKRKKKHESEDAESSQVNQEEEEEPDPPKKVEKEEEKEKEKRYRIPKKAPPPVDFFELMKIAAKKQHEPIVIEKKVEEPERPMTMKEKLEHQREMDWKNRKNNPKSSSKPSEKPPASNKDDNSSKTSKGMKTTDTSDSLKSKSIIKPKTDLNTNSVKSQPDIKKSVKFGANPIDKMSSSSKSSFNNARESGNNLKDKPRDSREFDSKDKTRDSKEANSKDKSRDFRDTNAKTSSNISKFPSSSKMDMKEPPSKVDVSDIDREIELLMKKKRMLMESAKSQNSSRNESPPPRRDLAKSRKDCPPYQKDSPRPRKDNSPPPKDSPMPRKDNTPPRKDSPRPRKDLSPPRKASPQSRKDPLPSQRPSSQSSSIVNKGSKSGLPERALPSSKGSFNGSPSKISTGERDRTQSKIARSSEQGMSSGRPAEQGMSSGRPEQRMSSGRPEQRMSSGRPEQRMSSGRPEQRMSSGGPPRRLPPPYDPERRMPPQMKKRPMKRVIDSESEYDSEMDDFIDDGPDESMDYSKHIKEIFGYDKSRYAHIDEDECEESSFKTQMIEERHSAKIGLLEDLEDIQREKEEKARAKMRKKMRR